MQNRSHATTTEASRAQCPSLPHDSGITMREFEPTQVLAALEYWMSTLPDHHQLRGTSSTLRLLWNSNSPLLTSDAARRVDTYLGQELQRGFNRSSVVFVAPKSQGEMASAQEYIRYAATSLGRAYPGCHLTVQVGPDAEPTCILLCIASVSGKEYILGFVGPSGQSGDGSKIEVNIWPSETAAAQRLKVNFDAQFHVALEDRLKETLSLLDKSILRLVLDLRITNLRASSFADLNTGLHRMGLHPRIDQLSSAVLKLTHQGLLEVENQSESSDWVLTDLGRHMAAVFESGARQFEPSSLSRW